MSVFVLTVYTYSIECFIHAATNQLTIWRNHFIDSCNHTTSSVGQGRSTVTFTSSIIGIFQMKFFTFLENGTRKDIPLEEEVEIVIGRDKVMMSSMMLMLKNVLLQIEILLSTIRRTRTSWWTCSSVSAWVSPSSSWASTSTSNKSWRRSGDKRLKNQLGPKNPQDMAECYSCSPESCTDVDVVERKLMPLIFPGVPSVPLLGSAPSSWRCLPSPIFLDTSCLRWQRQAEIEI